MKKIFSLILLVIALNAQTNTEEWREIANLDRDNLPKSALEKVELIYQKAKEDGDENQLIKSLIYKNRYISTLKENGIVDSIKNIEKEIESTHKTTTKLILKSILAEMYSHYLDEHLYKIKKNYNKKGDDIEHWGLKTLVNNISKLYFESLGEEAKYIKIEKYKTILTEEENSQGLRPTLYDFLAFRALRYFNNSRSYLTKPVYDFYIKEKEAFGSIQSFIDHKFQTPNPNSFRYKTLLIYQDLLRFHKARKDTKALQHINLKRIEFVYNNFVGDLKEKYYIDALNSLESQQMYGEALYYLAEYYYQKKEYLKAIGYAKRGIGNRDKVLSQKSLYIKRNIELQSLEIDIERVNLPDENILAKLSYRNIDRVFIRVIKMTQKEMDKLDNISFDKRDKYIQGLESINEFNLSLPIADDYKQHYTEISLGSYGYGHYIFLVSKDNKFNKFSKSLCAISKIAYFHKNSKLMVVDRESGKPLEGVEAKLYIEKYDRNEKRTKEFISTKRSDKDGIITLPKREHEYIIHLKRGKDSLNFARETYFEDYNQKRYIRKTLHIFTDRAIYRPAQTIYFKGLAIERGQKTKPKILINKEIKVTLYDSNGQKIETKSFTTNEFGTINGFFTLPKSGRLGSMHISSDIGGTKELRVEEYKRPKFEILFDKLDSSYRLGDSITLKGKAKAYAGNGIEKATVKYAIKRESSSPWYSKEIYNSSKIIARGEVETDKNGEFKINFDAVADKAIAPKSRPNFSYTVLVDITDTTGETQSSSKTINLGFVAINVSMIIDNEINIDSNKSLKLETTNLDGGFEAIKGKITIERLKQPKKIYRDRYWSIKDIDMPLYDKEQFQKLFKNYRPIEKLEQEKKLISTLKFDTQKSKFLSLGELAQGEYVLTLYTKDRYGTEVQKSKNITIYDLNTTSPPYQTQLWSKTDKEKYKVGSTATLYIKSSSPDSFVFFAVERDGKIVNKRWIKMSKIDKELIKIEKKDRGDIFYYLIMVKNNREYSDSGTIKVPWNKELKVEYRSFRDKLKPNQNEQWSIKISGEDKDKVVAEMVATMYDASLDEFVKHNYNIGNLFPQNYHNSQNMWIARTFSLLHQNIYWKESDNKKRLKRVFPHLNIFNNRYGYDSYSNPYYPESVLAMAQPISMPTPAPTRGSNHSVQLDMAYEYCNYINPSEEDATSGMGGDIITKEIVEPKPITIRKNLKETMFFKPTLRTDGDGNIIINFKTNEALTRWKFLAFVHTKELKTAITQKEIVTQKELMVTTNLPRFFREGDIITLSAKVTNMSHKDLNGTCQLLLVDPQDNLNIYGDHNFSKKISLKKETSTNVSWKIKIPQVDSVSTLQHTIIAKTDLYSDAEQVIKPILSNREFITESKVLSIKAKEAKSFTLNSLKNSHSNTLKNHKLTLEFTSNPIWYAIKSLPYLMEYPHECSEQLFNRYFANALASKIANSTPKIKEIFDSWRSKKELKSALTTNQELKSLLIEETPWVLDAQSQEEQQKNLALLFDLHRLAKEQESALSKLLQRQKSDGGWAWFTGGKSDWFITQYIVEGFAKLKELGVQSNNSNAIKKAIAFIDTKVKDNYIRLKEAVERGDMSFDNRYINSITIHYLYSRSFYKLDMDRETQEAYNYNLSQIEKYWTEQGIYEQGLIALTLYKKGKMDTAKKIVKSLKERALVNNELGMYFKYPNNCYWNELPIETHALMIDVFDTITNDKESVEQLKIWLLKNRQTTHWKTTKATASAILALLTNDSWLGNDKLIDVSFDTKVEYQPILAKAKASAQKGSGYFKVSFDKFDKDMATVKVKNPNSNIAWGSLYWQYFEELNKIKDFKESPLTIDKKLYLLKGDTTTPIESHTILKVGDKIKVQLRVKTDRAMEYIMLKDSRASAFEPTNILSQYRWQNSLGYYESTKDNATYFFIDRLKRGTYIFEYTLFVTHRGSFSNGIATIESMYAPEFKSHSKGEQINVK
jgi:uncharacterized protein YfaS (alpha-2-macroglobulin family)